MLKIQLPDGSHKEFSQSVTPLEVAQEIGPGLAKAALAAKVDGAVVGLDFPILIATTEILNDYEFFGLPTTFIISREGRIVEVLDGAQSLDVFEPLVRRHL